MAAVLLAVSLLAGCSGTSPDRRDASPTMFGTMASPCGPGEAHGATARGVTDTTITIGFGDDSGNPSSPGLNAEMGDAVSAMIDWCNAQGGIEGRRIIGDRHDAAITKVAAVMGEACDRDFMLVGQGWLLDEVQEPIRIECDLATVPTFAVSQRFAGAPLMVQPSPDPSDRRDAAGAFLMADRHPNEVRRAATMLGNVPEMTAEARRSVEANRRAGWEYLDCSQTYNVGGESNWTPFVQRLATCGAEVVQFFGAPGPGFEGVLAAARAIGFEPIWMQTAAFYDPNLAAWNANGLADDVFVSMTYYPFEQSDLVPAVAQYLELLRSANGAVGLLGAQAAAAFLLWAQGARTCGSNLTGECVIDALGEVTSFTAGGLQSPTDPAHGLPSSCALVLRLRGTRYEQVLPDELATQACDRSYLVSIPD